MRVLVTGSSGQIGSYVVDEVRSRGSTCTGFDLRPSSWTDLVGDIRDGNAIAAAVAGCDAVIHCAANVSVEGSLRDPTHDADHNVVGTLRVIQAACEAGVQRFVFVSSAAVYGNASELPVRESSTTSPLSPYGVSKLAGELYSRALTSVHGREVVIVRPFNVYSPRQDPATPYAGVMARFTSRVIAGEFPLVRGEGRQTRDFVHAHDVARFLVDAAAPAGPVPAGTIYNLGWGVETSITELARRFIRAAGLSGDPISAPSIEGEVQRSVADVGRARSTGWSPAVGLDNGLRELIEVAGRARQAQPRRAP